jgi:hypothetical protein
MSTSTPLTTPTRLWPWPVPQWTAEKSDATFPNLSQVEEEAVEVSVADAEADSVEDAEADSAEDAEVDSAEDAEVSPKRTKPGRVAPFPDSKEPRRDYEQA